MYIFKKFKRKKIKNIEEGKKEKKYIKKNKCSKCRTPTQIHNTHTHIHRGGIAVWRGRNKIKIRSA